MFEKVKPYMGNYMLYTKKAVACIAFATLCSVVPYFLLYGMIHPLVTEGTLLWSNVLLLITGTALSYPKCSVVCEGTQLLSL